MHTALSVPCTHNPKNLIIGLYNGETNSIIIEHPRGPIIRNMGKADSHGRLNLLPEEALYLVERGSLYLQYASGELEGVGMSLQACYAYLMGEGGLTLERYTVFTGLKRGGYVVQRGPAWEGEDYDKDWVKHREREKEKPLGMFARFYKALFDTQLPDAPPLGPLVAPGFYRSYNDIYRLLTLIPTHDPSLSTDRESRRSSAFIGHPTAPIHPRIRVSFYVWKPSSDFKKSAPPPPDFRIAVISAREQGLPVLEQLDDLLQSVPYKPPPPGSEGQVYRRVKHGWRNVVLAIVDQGVVSYMRVADAGFGKEKIYDRGARGGRGKRGGMRGGRGRGRGRGR